MKFLQHLLNMVLYMNIAINIGNHIDLLQFIYDLYEKNAISRRFI